LPRGWEHRIIDGVTRRGSSPVFVGRRAELDRLDDALRRAALGQPSFVLVAGEAGVGKSRLIAEFEARAEATGATSITGGCLDLGEGGAPYAPLVEALRALARRLEPAATEAALGPLADVLGILIPGLREPRVVGAHVGPTDQGDPANRLARLFDAVIAALGGLARERPLTLVIEDIHWADGSTRDLIRFLVRNLRDERLLMVATYRSDDLHRRHPLMPLLGELERADRVERLELDRFDRDELGEQLMGILGEAPSSSLVDVLLERSDGLPFYVEELVAGSEGDVARLPSTLRDILGLRMATLSPDTLIVVRAAAVIGRQFSHARLAAVAGVDEDALIGALHEAIDARILVPIEGRDGSDYAFRHALLREAAMDDQLPAERVRLHARLADYLGESMRTLPSPDPSIVGDFALHAYDAHDLPRALEGSVRALRMFVDAVAYREALGHAERALELWARVDDAPARTGIDHADLLLVAGRMASAANRPEQAMALTQEALAELGEDGHQDKRAAVLADLQWYAWEARAFDLSMASAEGAYELVSSGEPSGLKAQITTILGAQRWWDGRLHESTQLLEEAMAISEAIGDRSAWVEAANMLAHTLADLGQADRAAALIDRSSEAWLAGEWRVGRISSEVDRSIAALTCGRFAEAERIATMGLELARRYGWEGRFGPAFRSSVVDALFEQGRYEEAEPTARPVLMSTGTHHMDQWMATTMARVAVAQGRFEEAHRLLDLGPKEPTLNERAFTTVAVVDLARAEARLPDVIEAVDAIAAGIEKREAVAPAWVLLGLGIGACADGSARARRRRKPADAASTTAHAERWLASLRNLAKRHHAEGGGGPLFEAILATAEAEMGRAAGVPDPDAWAMAVERWVGLSHRHQAAYARLRLVEASLHRKGDRRAALEALREAHRMASTIGAMPLRAEIEALAAEARLRIDEVEPLDADTTVPAAILTIRERDVLRLVAEGHTNREIGDRLFISEKTVSVHVSNAMAKLGALSRYEAAAAAERFGHLR
jgi:DNA-binding CsgD family transcriptional regulator